MKKVIVIGILLISSLGFTQNQVNIDSISKFHFIFSNDITKFKAEDISYLKKFDYSAKNTLSVYNPLTGFNDIYIKSNDSYFSNHSSLTKTNVWTGERKDSFNPSGSQNIGSALVLGFLNTIFR